MLAWATVGSLEAPVIHGFATPLAGIALPIAAGAMSAQSLKPTSAQTENRSCPWRTPQASESA